MSAKVKLYIWGFVYIIAAAWVIPYVVTMNNYKQSEIGEFPMLYFWFYQVCLIPLVGGVFVSTAGIYKNIGKSPIIVFIVSRLLMMLILSPVLWFIAYEISNSVNMQFERTKPLVFKHILIGLFNCPNYYNEVGNKFSLPAAIIMTSILACPFYNLCDSFFIRQMRDIKDNNRFTIKWVAGVNGFVFGVQILVLIGVLVFNIMNR